VEGLLQRVEQFALTSEELRDRRAIEVLEHLGTPEARRVMEKAARGVQRTIRTEDAGEALQRLAGRRTDSH
jgi:hypothetical protein